MRPDLDDFEEMNQDAAVEPRSRAMSWLVLAVAVIGFAALAYYAYQSGTRSMNDGNVMVVNAEPGAVKEAPASPGGEEFPNQDKTIYNAVAPDTGGQKVEKLLPDSEQPTAAAQGQAKGANNTTTYVNNSLNKDGAASEDESAPPQKVTAEETPPPEAMPPQNAPKAAPAIKPAPAPVLATPVPAVATPVPAITPKQIPIETVDEPLSTATSPPKAETTPKTTPAKAAAPVASGSYKIQLGAFQSQAEAKSNWTRIQHAHTSVLKGSPVIVRADLPNGTFYRLRASGYASADAAKAACAKLSAAGQGCFYVGK